MLDKSDTRIRERSAGAPGEALGGSFSALRSLVLLASVAIGAAVPSALPLDLSRQYQVEARLEIVTRRADTAAADRLLQRVSDELHSPALLDQLQAQMNLIAAPGFAGNTPTSLDFLTDIMARREMTVAAQESAARERLSRMLSVSRPQGSNLLVIEARAGDAEAAAVLANSAADLVARRLEAKALNGETEAVETARKRLDEAQVTLDRVAVEPSELEKQRALEDARAILDAEHTRVTASIDATAQRAQVLSSLNVADVLTKPLPPMLDGSGLDDLRQRHLEASLQVDRLSADFGPLHPRLIAAKGALDEARAAIGAALQRLGAGYRQQGQALTQELAALEKRRTELNATPVSAAVQQRMSLETEVDAARKAYLEAMRGGGTAERRAPELRPEGGADPQLAVASGLPRWLHTLIGGLSGLCLGAALLPARRREEPVSVAELPARDPIMDPKKVAVQAPVAPMAVPAAPVMAVSPVLEPAAPVIRAAKPVALPPMPSFDDYYRDERLLSHAVEEDLAEELGEDWVPPVADNDDEIRRLQQILLQNLRPVQPEQPLPQLLAQIMSRQVEQQEDPAARSAAQEVEIERMRREIAALRRQVLDYRDHREAPETRRYATRR